MNIASIDFKNSENTSKLFGNDSKFTLGDLDKKFNISLPENIVNDYSDIKFKEVEEADSFVKEKTTEKKAEKTVSLDENTSATKAKNEVKSTWEKLNTKYSNAIKNEVNPNEECKNLVKLMEELNFSADELATPIASNTTVIESAKVFQSKAKEFEELANTYVEKNHVEETKESAFELETIQDKKDSINGIQTAGIQTNDENILGNNPFFNSAMNTFDCNFDKLAV